MSSSDSSSKISVDAVFVIGTGSKNNNEELKYALRNLERNCPFVRDVYISGECPSWIDTSTVKHLKWPDRFTHAKDANIIDKLRHACEQPGISEHILFCSDDQFQTRVCTWDDFSPRYLRQYTESDSWYEDRKRIWHSRLRKTLERDRLRRAEQNLDRNSVYYYQPHMWMQINRDKFIEYAKWCNYEHRDDTIIASGYFNYINAGGKSNFDHIFISSNQKWPVNVTHVAYSDTSFTSAMSYLKKEFTDPSRYEIEWSKNHDKYGYSNRTDDEIINDLKEKIYSEPAWKSLIPEVEEAERLRNTGINGWKKVWNDLIRRWSADTQKGKLKIPVVSGKSTEAKLICLSSFTDLSSDSSVVENSTVGKKRCSKCEENKRKAREANIKNSLEVRRKLDEFVARNKNRKKQSESTCQSDDSRDSTTESINDDYACIDCAIEHLSNAVAYMSSNALRPDEFETELARGEVRVAAQHLLALNHQEEYNRCIRMLDSIYSEYSLFSVSELKDLLKTVLDRRSRP